MLTDPIPKSSVAKARLRAFFGSMTPLPFLLLAALAAASMTLTVGCRGRAKRPPPKAPMGWEGLTIGMSTEEAKGRMKALGWTVSCQPAPSVMYLADGILTTHWVKAQARGRTERCDAQEKRAVIPETDPKGDSRGEAKGHSGSDSESSAKGGSEGQATGSSKGGSKGESKGHATGSSKGGSKGGYRRTLVRAKLFFLDGVLAQFNIVLSQPDEELVGLLTSRWGKPEQTEVAVQLYAGGRQGKIRLFQFQGKAATVLWLRRANFHELIFLEKGSSAVSRLQGISSPRRDG